MRFYLIQYFLFFILFWQGLYQAVFAQQDEVAVFLSNIQTYTDTSKVNHLLDFAAHHQRKDAQKAYQYAQKALEIAQKANFTSGEASALRYLGNIYWYQTNYPQALEYYLKAQVQYEKMGDYKGLTAILNNMGSTHKNAKNFEAAQKYYEQALTYAQKSKDINAQGVILGNIGAVCVLRKDFKKALRYCSQSLKIYEQIEEPSGLILSYYGMADLYQGMNVWDSALYFYDKTLKLSIESKDLYYQGLSYSNMGKIALEMKNYAQAKTLFHKSILLSHATNSKMRRIEAYKGLATIAHEEGKYLQAYQYLQQYGETKDSVFNEENNNKLKGLEASFQLEKQQNQIAILTKEKQISNLFMVILCLGLLLVLGLLFSFYKNIKQKNKTNQLLTLKNEEIAIKNATLEQQKEEIKAQAEGLQEANDSIRIQSDLIEAKNKKITASIHYAKRIQEAMLPSEQSMKNHLSDFFILFMPKDIVSGDFYYCRMANDQKIILAAVDCTGHGVPGALMSMAGNQILNEIVSRQRHAESDKILNILHKGIRKALKQEENDNKDGMDIALCVIDKEKNTVEFSGAKNPLVYVKDGILHHIKGNVFAIGGEQVESERKFAKHIIPFDAKTTFYLYSDGYQDQFGGEKNTKFMSKNFRNLLLDLHALPLPTQKKMLQETLALWAKQQEQVDDILVIGFRI